MAGVVELMRSWWQLDFEAPANELALVHLVCSADGLEQLPWPQDELVEPSIVPSTGELVIAHENQYLWEARIDPHDVAPRVRFFVGDERVEIGPTMPAAEFLLRVVVEAAVYADEHRIRCRVRDAEAVRSSLIVDEVQLEPQMVQFPGVAAGPGWLGVISGSDAWFVTQGSLDELAAQLANFGEAWRQRVGPGSGDLGPDPWNELPAGAGEVWRDL